MRLVEQAVTYLLYSLILAVIVRNPDSVSAIVNSISSGTQGVFGTILAGSRGR